jgi:hypothetical protein
MRQGFDLVCLWLALTDIIDHLRQYIPESDGKNGNTAGAGDKLIFQRR